MTALSTLAMLGYFATPGAQEKPAASKAVLAQAPAPATSAPAKIAPPDMVAATIRERAWSSPIWYTPGADERKNAKAGITVADLRERGAAPLTDAQLKALIVEESTWLTNNVTGDKYMIIYGALGKGAAAKPLTPVEPGYVTQRFPSDQGELQLRYVGKKMTLQSLSGDATDSSYLGGTRSYFVRDGKIVTALAGTPIEIAVYKVGNKYVGARSNEFGYANYEIIQAPKEVSPLR